MWLFVTPLLVGILAALIIPRIFSNACSNSVIDEVISPDNKNKIIIFIRNCGATTGFSTQVTLLAEGNKLQNKSGNIFIADTDHSKAPSGVGGGPAVTAQWKSNEKIILTYHDKARVFKSETNFRGIEIEYNQLN